MRGLSSTAGGWENLRCTAFSRWSQADRPKNQRQQTWTNVAQRNSRRRAWAAYWLTANPT